MDIDKVFSVRQIKQHLKKLEDRSQRSPELLGYKSQSTLRKIKKLIQLCSQVSISFLKYKLFQEAQWVLEIALNEDIRLNKHGRTNDKVWPGRVLLYNCFGLLYYQYFVNRQGKTGVAIKKIFQSVKVLCAIEETGSKYSVQIGVATGILTFMALWKIKKFKQAQSQIHFAAKQINKVISGEQKSNLKKADFSKIYALVIVGLAACACQLENSDTAISLCQQGLLHIENSQFEAKKLILDMKKRVIENKNKVVQQFQIFVQTVLFTQENLSEKGKNLITNQFQEVFFDSVFLQFIRDKSPVIRLEELENMKKKVWKVQNRNKQRFVFSRERKRTISNKTQTFPDIKQISPVIQDSKKKKHQKSFLERPNMVGLISPHRYQSQPRGATRNGKNRRDDQIKSPLLIAKPSTAIKTERRKRQFVEYLNTNKKLHFNLTL